MNILLFCKDEKTYSIFCILLFLFFISACSSASEETIDNIINTEKADSISGKKDSNAENTDSITGKTDQSGEGVIAPEEELPDTIFKLEEYIQLHHGNNYGEGAAQYGDYLFQASLGSELHIYNFAEKKYITTIKLSSIGHADTMCFGIEKVDENDEFPVLYISESKVYEEGKKGDIYVYRLLRETDEQGVESWKGALCQRIKTPDVAIAGAYPDVVIDEKNKDMWIVGVHSRVGYNSNDGCGWTYIFSKYSLPSITDGTKNKNGIYQLLLSEEGRQSYFLLYDLHATTQGLCFYNGMIICPYGKPAVSYKGIDFVDVNKQQVIANVNLAGSIIYEAEAAVVANDELYIVGQKNFVYKCSGIDISSLSR